MHPPSRCACFVVKASHNAHCMVDPPTWVGVTHGGAGSGGRCRFRPTFNLVRENVMCSCGTLVGFGVWLISNTCEHKIGGMASPPFAGKGPSCLACDRPGVLSCTTWEGLYFRSSSGH
ncbi:hypothetical protein VNO80_34493 [Phaseolus coccineus]|uniref:Uncharacterized protein n=1 Tax=Phaseolus coccineus TaxID=3886 RepID=A0AAN9Q814_PHACN